jgi:hypothetical protein
MRGPAYGRCGSTQKNPQCSVDQLPPPVPLCYRRAVSSTSGPGSKPPLTPILDGFGKPDGKRDAAMSEYGKQLAGAELDVLDDTDEDPAETARRAAGKNASATAARPMAPRPAVAAKPVAPASSSTSDVRPSLEPVSEDVHKHRRLPTQPPANLVLDLDGDNQLPEPARPAARPSAGPSAGSSGTVPLGSSSHLSRQSPAPVRRGLFSGDRITNMLASAALGLVITIFPAKQMARSYEVTKVQPMLTDLEGAIDHPLGVQAGLVAKPEKIAAEIHDGREHVRRRYMMIWLMVGLPLGIGLGFAPRPGD